LTSGEACQLFGIFEHCLNVPPTALALHDSGSAAFMSKVPMYFHRPRPFLLHVGGRSHILAGRSSIRLCAWKKWARHLSRRDSAKWPTFRVIMTPSERAR
jgi:hypothetical protein